jgi:hypothetical protein
MYDSITAAQIPPGADLVAGYVDGRYAWSAADWERFPDAVHVRIAVFPTTNDGHVLDCELGDAGPAQCPDWVRRRRAAGVDPTVYCSWSAWPEVKSAFAAAGVTPPHWWISGYPGPVDSSGHPIIPTGAVAHQWIDHGLYDESMVADYWPGVDLVFHPLEDDMPRAVIYMATAQEAGGTPLYPHGVLRDEFGVYLGLQNDAERANLETALGAQECWLKESSLTALVELSRVGVTQPRPPQTVIVESSTPAPPPAPAPAS